MEYKKEKVKKEIQSTLIDKAPNSILHEMLYSKLNKFPESLINKAIQELKSEEVIIEKTTSNKLIPGRIITAIRLKNYKNIPIKTSIEIGSVTLPRFISGDLVGGEIFNYAFEVLSKYNSELEDRFKEISEELTKGYWKNLISIFGIMLSTFAIIIKAISNITPLDYQTVSIENIFLIRLAESLPLGIVLFIGIFLDRKIID